MSFLLLVGRFGDLVRSQPLADEPVQAAAPFPEGLRRMREICGHHMVLLMLLAQADGDRDTAEKQEVLRHCGIMAKRAGTVLSAEDQSAIAAYLEEFSPTKAQLDPAMRRLESDTRDDFAALLAAAQKVIEADGVQRQEEIRLLEFIHHDLAAI